MKPLPTQDRLKEILDYDPETGVLRWRVQQARMKAGDIAGSTTDTGYWRISIDGRVFKAHRIIWKFMTGEDPPAEVDHVDTIGLNNRWSNLRLASSSQNKANARLRSDNTSGLKGSSWHKQIKRWISYIHKDGKRHHLGTFDSAQDAHAAYLIAATRMHGEFARAA